MPEPRILLSGVAFGESLRWHQDRLWFANWGTQEVLRADLDGTSEVVAHIPTTIRSPSIGCLMGACSSCQGKSRSSCAWSRTGR
jgi:sugar lactone lactonase YvrE